MSTDLASVRDRREEKGKERVFLSEEVSENTGQFKTDVQLPPIRSEQK